VEESFSNESLRAREGEGSSDASIVLHGNHSEIWEPARKSRLLSDNVSIHWQREISEPDEVNGRDGTISTAFYESTSSIDNVIANPELEVESPKDSITPMVEEVFSQDVHEPVTESSKNDITLPVEMGFSLAGHEIVKTEDSEGANYINECRITASRCSATAASELITAIDNSYEENATRPVEKLPSLDLCELTEGVAGGKTTAINESDMTTSTCKVTAASGLVLAEDNGTVPMKKRSTLDLRESTNGVGIHDTTVVDTSEITTFTCNVTAASEFTTAEDKIEDETTSKDERESTASINDIISTDETSITTESNEAVSEAQQVLFTLDRSAEEITLLAVKVSPLQALKPAGAIPIDETPITDASNEEVSEAPQVLFAVKGYTEEITLPAENVSSLHALKPAEAIPTDETPITDEAVSAAPSGSIAVDRSTEDITLPAKNGSSLDALKTAEAIGTDETTGDLIFMNDITFTTSSC